MRARVVRARVCLCVCTCMCACTCLCVHVCVRVCPSVPPTIGSPARPPFGVQQTSCPALQLCGRIVHNRKVRHLCYGCAGQFTARMSSDLISDLLEIVCFTTDATLNDIITSETFPCERSNQNNVVYLSEDERRKKWHRQTLPALRAATDWRLSALS